VLPVYCRSLGTPTTPRDYRSPAVSRDTGRYRKPVQLAVLIQGSKAKEEREEEKNKRCAQSLITVSTNQCRPIGPTCKPFAKLRTVRKAVRNINLT
jgi:hypothetical protein